MKYDEKCVLDKLVQLRKAAGFTQKKVEEQLELRTGTVYDHEKGRLKISLELAFQLCALYGAEVTDLLETEMSSPKADFLKINQLVKLCLLANDELSLMGLLKEDPIIVAEIGLEGLQSNQTILELLLGKLSASQRRNFVVELFKYVNSLIGSDRRISEAELQLRNIILSKAPIEFNERELGSIKKAFTQSYLGKNPQIYFPRDAYKHYLIWFLFIVALVDGVINHNELSYIKEVAKNLSLKVSAFDFIASKIDAAKL